MFELDEWTNIVTPWAPYGAKNNLDRFIWMAFKYCPVQGIRDTHQTIP